MEELNPIETAVITIKKVGLDELGVIEKLGVKLVMEMQVQDIYTKEELSSDIAAMEADGISVTLKTEDGTEVIIVKDGDKTYFRTKGDDSKTNDLLDLPRLE